MTGRWKIKGRTVLWKSLESSLMSLDFAGENGCNSYV